MEHARAETIRYHSELYSNSDLLQPDTWLHKPAAFVMRAASHLAEGVPVQVLDLGAGVGRHSIPIAQMLPEGSKVTAVDLLPVAVEQLRRLAADAGLEDRIGAHVADVESYTIPADKFHLIIGCSVLEHVQSMHAFEKLLHHIRQGTAPDGINCLVIGTDRQETYPSGDIKQALIELPLTAEDVTERLHELYNDWTIIEQSTDVFEVDEMRDGEQYILSSKCVRLTARRRSC